MFSNLWSFIFFITFLVISPQLSAYNYRALSDLENFFYENHADSILVLNKGRPIFDQQSNDQFKNYDFDAIEITDLFLTFAVLFLVEDGYFPGLDVKIAYFYPNCTDRNLTIKNLIDGSLLSSIKKQYPLSHLIERLTQQSIEDYLHQKLFLPLNANSICWRTIEGELNPRLQISGKDLAKVGSFIINNGCWCSQQILRKEVLQLMLMPQVNNPFFGLGCRLELYNVALWWDEQLLECYRLAGIDPDMIDRLSNLQGRVLHCKGQFYQNYYLTFSPSDLNSAFGTKKNAEDFLEAIQRKDLPLARWEAGKIRSIGAIGQGGQQLVILPQEKIVAVRQNHLPSMWCNDHLNFKFVKLIEKIAEPIHD